MHGGARLSHLFVISAFCIWAPHEAYGQYVDGAQLAKVSEINVRIANDLEDRDCLFDPDTLETEAELVLRRSGIAVRESHVGNHIFMISIAGYKTSNDLCVASYQLDLYKWEALLDFSAGFVYSFFNSGVMSGSPSDFQDRLRSRVNETTTALANEILKARQ